MRAVTRGVLGALSLVLIAYTLYIIIWPLRWRLLLVWPVVEALFFVCVFLPRYDRLNKQPQPHEPAGHDAMRCWRRFLLYASEVPGGMDSAAYITGWFRGAEPAQVKRGAAAQRRPGHAQPPKAILASCQQQQLQQQQQQQQQQQRGIAGELKAWM
jgi:hypothetical protein